MDILKVHAQVMRGLMASLFCCLLVACQQENKDKTIYTGPPIGEKVGQVRVPEAFTPDSARKLGSQLEATFKELHKKRGFNGTVLITKYDQVIWKGAFGYADFKSKDTLTTQTAFQLASVSKQFTAMAIMMLQERGKLHYDDSVQQYLPTFPYKGITIRQLLTHRSGLPNYTYFSDALWTDRNKAITNKDVVNLMREHQPTVYYQPDTHFDYSNTGYALLASIVTEVSGVPFAKFLKKEIFEPLGMTHTFTFSRKKLENSKNVAAGHTGGRRRRSPDYLDTVLGDKGVYSTVEDLYKWDQALYHQKLVKNKTLKEAFTGSWLKKNKEEDYGFGWRIRPLENGDTAVYHGGLWHGYSTYLLRNPNDHSAIIVLSNVPNSSMRHLKELRSFLYPPKPMITANEKQDNVATSQR